MDTGAAYLEISEGELFVALEYDDGWLRVQRAGVPDFGWVPSSFVSPVSRLNHWSQWVPPPPAGQALSPPASLSSTSSSSDGPREVLEAPSRQPLPSVMVGSCKTFHGDGSAENFDPDPDQRGGFASVAVEVLAGGRVDEVGVKEVEGKFRGPLASELLAAHLVIEAVERAIWNAPPVAQYWLGFDNDRVVDWCKDGPIVKKGRRYEIFIELMRRFLSRVKELAASRGSELIVYHEPSETNKAHATANDRLRRLRDSGFLAADVVEDAELLRAIASVRV